jgi:hypothetical protein
MEPPQVRAVFLANEHGSADGMWTLEAVASALAPMSANDPPTAGFACGGHAWVGRGNDRLRPASGPEQAELHARHHPSFGSLPAARVMIER